VERAAAGRRIVLQRGLAPLGEGNVATLEDIFLAAVEKAPADRAVYLDAACGSDAELRAQVEALVRSHEEAGSLLEQPLFRPGPTVDEPTAAAHPGAVIGPYKLIEQIGEGGMGAVWMAQQQEPVKRLVAVKLIKAGMDSRQVIARFEAERQALALMDHPNIAKVLDGGTAGSGRPYFVMDLVKGVPITKYCDERYLTPRQRLELFLPVCQAVQHAHQKGIIHRDLKPSNVLVALFDGQPVPKVIDFGVAKAAGQPLTDKTLVTGFGAIVGTLEYMAPEQAEVNQLDIDTRSDIYSLGVLLYELLAGSPPFTRKELEKAGMLEMLRVIREQEPSKPSTKLSTADGLPTLAANRGTEPAKLTKLVRGELDWIVMKALEKDRSRRYETANGFAADVQRYLCGEAVQAVPPSAGYRLRKFARRNKGGLAVAALVLSFLVLLGSGAGWAWRDRSARAAEAARQQGERQARKAGQVESIFAEVDRLEKEQKWPEALAAARQAAAAVAGGEADAETTERVHARLKDLEFIDRLEQIRLDYKYKNQQAEEYARAFQEHGVDVEKLAVEASIERLKTRPELAIPLAAALDEWAYTGTDQKRLVAIARGIDPEPLRDRLRSIWLSIWYQSDVDVQDELRRLAESINVRAHRPVTLISLSRALRNSNLPDTAIRILREANFASPGDFWLNYELGWTLAAKKDYAGAIRFYTAAVCLRSNTALGVGSLGEVLRSQGKPDEAVPWLRKALELEPKSPNPWYQYLGEILRRQGKLDEAVAVYREYVEAYGTLSDSHHQLGLALRAQGKLDEANAAFDRAIELERKALERSPDYLSLAYALQDRGKLDEAADAYRKAIEYEPDGVLHYVNLGRILHAQGKLEEAIAAYRQAIKNNEKYAPTYTYLGAALHGQKKLDEAIAAYRKAIELDPKNAIAFANLGALLCDELKEYDQAIACFRTAIKLEPNNAHAYGNLGAALANRGKLDDAIAAFRKALEIDPKQPKADRNLRRAMAEKFRQFREMKNAAGCLAVAAEYEALKITDAAGKLYDAACFRALCASAILEDPKTPAADAARLARGQADLAMAWLHKAVAAGFKNARHMKQDKDLDALRDREDFKKLVADLESKRPLNDLAWELATDPNLSLRDPTRAVELAEKAVAELPKDANCWNTLGVARYRTADYKGAVAALMKYRELRTSDAEWTNPFFLAMAHWKLGQKDEAARWYKLAVEWMERKKADSEMMRRVRAEAAELLAVEKKKD
jgi:serine/threonine protein kinase/Flp pilus assembly protein TadD